MLQRTLASLADAVTQLSATGDGHATSLFLVDNTDDEELNRIVARSDPWRSAFADVVSISGQGNVGYGAGHNLALVRTDSRYHLVLNPDVELAPDALTRALAFLETEPEAVLLAPRVVDQQGNLQFLCRRVPTVFDLFLRGFTPAVVQRWFATRLARYAMVQETATHATFWNPPLVSGCFMLFRTAALREVGGFDARFFLYFEDYDLSLRIASLGKLVYFPAAQIIHHGGGAARKGWLHIRLFCTSAARFFSTHGWTWF